MLELWKPLMTLKDKDNPVLFSEICEKYSKAFGEKRDIRPFVIFYDDKIDCYYYIKSRAATNKYTKNKKGEEVLIKKSIKKGEILIEQSNNNGLFYKDSYVDCSQIFIMQKDELESLIDFDSEDFKKTLKLNNFYISEILDNICKCMFEVPPYLSILKVFINKQNKTEAESLYLCDEKINDVCKLLEAFPDYELDEGTNLLSFFSNKSNESTWSNNRYYCGISFCINFLQEYFPNKINQFIKIQELEKDFDRPKPKDQERER